MSPLHFLVFALVCLTWAISNVLITNLVGGAGFPPVLFAVLRFTVVAIATARWLFPLPARPMQLIWLSLTVGLHYPLFFCGLASSNVSTVSIVGQLTVPFTVILSVIFLRERCGLQRSLGTVLAIAGAALLLWEPQDFSLAPGLVLVVISSLLMAIAYVLLKLANGIQPLKLQASIAVFSLLPMAAVSAVLEDFGWATFTEAGLLLPATLVFSALVVTVVAHTVHFWLIQKYEAGSIASMSLMSPVFTVALGITINGDSFDWRTGAGAIVSLAGVGLVAYATMKPKPTIKTGQSSESRLGL